MQVFSRAFFLGTSAACGDVAPPVIDVTCGCLLRSPVEEDRGHRQTCVRLSKATWGNIIASRCRQRKGARYCHYVTRHKTRTPAVFLPRLIQPARVQTTANTYIRYGRVRAPGPHG